MKKKLQKIIVTLTIVSLLVGITVFAGGDIIKKADLYYKNIKIFVNGGEIIPKDVNGNIVEPFIMNGSTYLPVRAVAEALGQEVDWDGKTQTVYIGKQDLTKPDNYLDKVQYNDYKEGDSANSVTIANGTVTDFNGKVYSNGILFTIYGRDRLQDGTDLNISYPLNSQYSTLTGKIVIPKAFSTTTNSENNCDGHPATVYFYGDEGDLLYKATEVTASMPFSFEIDTEGVNQLTIKIISNGDYLRYNHIALTDLALYE